MKLYDVIVQVIKPHELTVSCQLLNPYVTCEPIAVIVISEKIAGVIQQA